MGKGRLQVGALPWRMEGGAVQVLLVTTRTTRRWIIPKGWPEADVQPHEQAAQEAWEEAGVRGEVGADSVGCFHYDKIKKSGEAKLVRVDVFPLAVAEELPVWPEAHERERRWLSPAEAADAVIEPELAAFIAGWSPPR